MGERRHDVDVRRFLPHAVVATLLVVIVPVVALFFLLDLAHEDPPLLFIAGAAVALAIVLSAIGAAVWSRRPESNHLQFGELMLWNWARRRQAEKVLLRNSELLGLDPTSGDHIAEPEMGPSEQLVILRDLMRALEVKDPYTRGHTARVERTCYNTSLVMRMPVKDIEDLRKAAAVHDVGKIRVPDSVLRKPDKLTEREWEIMKAHSSAGAGMVATLGKDEITLAVLHHHERWDGGGYPNGLQADEIPLFARIIAVADTYDAIRSDRAYRSASSRAKAVEIIRAERGHQFDPDVVDAFLTTVPTRVPFGAAVFGVLGEGMLRRVGSWLRTTGLAGMGPAAASGVAAVVIGASVFGSYSALPGKGPGGESRPSARSAASAPAEFRAEGRAVSGLKVLGARVERASKGRLRSKAGEPTVASRASGENLRTDAARPAEERGKSDGRKNSTESGGVGGKVPVPPSDLDVPDDPVEKVKDKVKREPGPKTIPNDPKPDEGRDCEPKKDSTGDYFHCG